MCVQKADLQREHTAVCRAVSCRLSLYRRKGKMVHKWFSYWTSLKWHLRVSTQTTLLSSTSTLEKQLKFPTVYQPHGEQRWTLKYVLELYLVCTCKIYCQGLSIYQAPRGQSFCQMSHIYNNSVHSNVLQIITLREPASLLSRGRWLSWRGISGMRLSQWGKLAAHSPGAAIVLHFCHTCQLIILPGPSSLDTTRPFYSIFSIPLLKKLQGLGVGWTPYGDAILEGGGGGGSKAEDEITMKLAISTHNSLTVIRAKKLAMKKAQQVTNTARFKHTLFFIILAIAASVSAWQCTVVQNMHNDMISCSHSCGGAAKRVCLLLRKRLAAAAAVAAAVSHDAWWRARSTSRWRHGRLHIHEVSPIQLLAARPANSSYDL